MHTRSARTVHTRVPPRRMRLVHRELAAPSLSTEVRNREVVVELRGNVELHVCGAQRQTETPVLEQVSDVQSDRAHQLVAAAFRHLQVSGW